MFSLLQEPQGLGRLTELLELDAAVLARTGARIVGIWIVVWLCWGAVRMAAARIVRAVDDGDESTLTAAEKRGQTIAQLLRSVGRVVILVIGLLLTLNLFIDIGPLLAGAGILGLAISFGAQSLVKDVIAGFFQLMENQFSVGDVVELAGKEGTVERMNLRVVHIRDAKGNVHIIPNGQIGVVTNMTKSWSRAVIDVGVGYGTDLDRALGSFRDEAAKLHDDPEWAWRFDGAPEVLGVQELGDSSMVIRTLLRVQPGKQWEVAREFRRRIKMRLDRDGIEIPFPQRVVRHVGGPVGKTAGGPGGES
jgi:small-conductance mechanosensitive channel